MTLSEFRRSVVDIVDAQLHQLSLSWQPNSSRVKEAAMYALKNGKRLRPLLVAASAHALGVNIHSLLPVMTAVECLHAFSLIHDDLPSLDNDDVRRGLPSTHKAFGEDIAILAGDALSVCAFNILLREESMPKTLALALSQATLDMIHGQELDIQKPSTPQELLLAMRLKTGAIIRLCVMAPTYLSTACTPEAALALEAFSHHFGLLYQIADDIEDEGDCVRMMGMQKSKELACENMQSACKALEIFHANDCAMLGELARTVYEKSCCKHGTVEIYGHH